MAEPGLPQSTTSNPGAEIREEYAKALASDDTALGEVWRRTQNHESVDQIRLALGNTSSGFVYNNLGTIRALLDSDLPTAPTVARSVARSFHRLLKNNEFSTPARRELEDRVALLQVIARDRERGAAEEQQAVATSKEKEAENLPGVYVYTFPHYLRYPYDPESGHTLFKVGCSHDSVIERIRNQTRTTAVPEEPLLLRVYETKDEKEAERTFHRLLSAADFDRSGARTSGTEWFLTSVRFLDEIAVTLRLSVHEVSDLADLEPTE